MIGAIFECNAKYELLSEILQPYIKNIQYSNNVNVIIDLKSIYKKAYRTDINNIITEQKIAIEDITSSIINIIGHYRNFLYKEGKYSTFYILYSENECNELIALNGDYKKKYYGKYLNNTDEFLNLNNIIKSVTNQIKILSKYIPHLKYIDTSKYDEFVYCNYLIREVVNKNDINIILSNDDVMLQALNRKTVCINLKGANTKLITANNAIDYLCESETGLTSNLLNIILSITGYSSYSINNIGKYGYKKTVKRLKNLIDSGVLLDKTYIQFPKEILIHDELFKEHISEMEENFKILFPLEVEFNNMIQLSTEYNINTLKSTINEFRALNNKIFVYYPINVDFLLKGESL